MRRYLISGKCRHFWTAPNIFGIKITRNSTIFQEVTSLYRVKFSKPDRLLNLITPTNTDFTKICQLIRFREPPDQASLENFVVKNYFLCTVQ